MINQAIDGLETLDSVAHRIKPMPIKFQTHEVSCTYGGVLKSFVESLYANLEMTASSNNASVGFAQAELEKYVWTLVVSRIAHVNQDTKNRVVHPRDAVAVPSFLSLLLRQIGIVEEIRHGQIFKPVVKVEKGTMLDIAGMNALSVRLKFMFNKYGFEYAEGFNTGKEGSFDFMTCLVAEDQVQSFKDDVPGAVAVLVAVLELHCARTVFMPTISYGTLSEYSELVKVLSTPRSLQ